jgi:WD40 repeat protein
VILLAFVMTLASCGGAPPPSPPLADLHLPGVTEIPNVGPLHRGPGTGEIEAITAYLPVGGGTARALLTIDRSPFDVALDGSGLRQLDIVCGWPVSVSPDGAWAACRDWHSVVFLPLTDAAPAQHPRIAPLPTDATRPPVVWLPDGRHLAALHTKNACALDVYAVDAASPPWLTLVSTLSFPTFAQASLQHTCSLPGFAWSPDGAWLALSSSHPAETDLVSLRTWFPDLLRPAAAPSELTVTPAMLVRVDMTLAFSPMSWSEQQGELVLTYVSQYRTQIRQFDVATRTSSILLSVPEGGIPALSWTPDGKQLVFAQSAGRCSECFEQPPERLYVFTAER